MSDDIKRVFLVVKADRSLRLLKVPRNTWSPGAWRPKLAQDEVAMAIEVRFPKTWGRVLDGQVTIDVPSAVPAIEAVGEPLTASGLGPSEALVRLVDRP